VVEVQRPSRGRSHGAKPYDRKNSKKPLPPLRREDIKCDFPKVYFDTLKDTLNAYQWGVARKRITAETRPERHRAILLDSFDVAIKRARQLESGNLDLLRDQRRRWFEETELQGGFDTYLGNSSSGGAGDAEASGANNPGAGSSSGGSAKESDAGSSSGNPEPMDTSGDGKHKIFGKSVFK
jgi:hypothetical protein